VDIPFIQKNWAGRTAHARADDGEKPSLGPEEEAEEGGEGHGNSCQAGPLN